jgi:hypothetical protein
MSYTLLDMDTVSIIGRVEKSEDAVLLEMVYYKDKPVLCCSDMHKSDWAKLTDHDARLLLRNLAGVWEPSRSYNETLTDLMVFCSNYPVWQVNRKSLEYSARIMRKEFTDPPPTAAVSDDSPAPKPQASIPSPKGATGRVWEIAEAKLAEENHGSMTIQALLANKAFRKIVIDACIAAGIHEATAATQWSKWKKSKGF